MYTEIKKTKTLYVKWTLSIRKCYKRIGEVLMITQRIKTMDGNEAAADVAYAFTEVATIYPITPSSPMAEHIDVWAARDGKISSASL